MEKLVEEVIKSKRITHKFYCDECGKYLGESTEYSDGWYPTPDEVYGDDITWYVFNRAYEIEKCLCKNCYEIFKDKLDKALLELGFERS